MRGIGGRRDTAVTLLALLLSAIASVVFGMPVRDLAVAVAVVLLTNVGPGVVIWRALRPRDGWWIEDIGLGWGCSLGCSVASAVAAGLVHRPWLSLVLPLALTALLLAVRPVRRRVLGARCARTPNGLGYAIGAALLLELFATIEFLDQNKLSWGRSVGLPYSDTYLHLAIAREIFERGPVAWPTVVHEPLGYHWFTHAWVAQIAGAGHLGVDVSLLRVLPLVAPVVVTLAIAGAALRITGSGRAATVAVVVATIGGVGSMVAAGSGNAVIYPNSPTVGMSIPPLLAATTLIALRWRGEAPPWSWLILFGLAIVATGSKGSTTPVLLCGLLLVVAVAAFVDRPVARTAAVQAVAVAGAIGVSLLVVFHGSADALTWGPAERSGTSSLGPLHGLPGIMVALSYAIITGLAPAALGVLALATGRVRREDPRCWLLWLLIGSTVAGSAAGALLVQPGGSQSYFAMSALPLAALASTVGGQVLLAVAPLHRQAWCSIVVFGLLGAAATWALPRILDGLPTGLLARIAAQSALAATLVALCSVAVWRLTRRRVSVVLCVALCGLGNTAVARAAHISDAPLVHRTTYSIRQFSAVTQGQVDAARFIGAHSGVTDLVMTNRHCGRPVAPDQPCDSRRWVVAAFSGRQLLVEAWGTTPTSAELRPHGRDLITLPYWNPVLLKLNDDFFVHPYATAQRELWARGVRWLYVDQLLAHATDLAPYAERRYQNADASAWQLLPPAR